MSGGAKLDCTFPLGVLWPPDVSNCVFVVIAF